MPSAIHPNDSPVPPQGYQGVDAVLGTVEGLKKFIAIQESPYHGLNFCQGSVSEMLANPGKEIIDVILYFGTRKKIFNVHFRNIKGRRVIHPDQAVFSPSDSGGEYTAFVYGYIRALIQAVDQLG